MRRFLAALATVALLAAGCGRKSNPDPVVPLDQIPAPAMQAAKDELPGVTFEMAWKVKDESGDAYEIRGKTKLGKIREIRVSPTGKVLEVE
jgi:hypothetical protein